MSFEQDVIFFKYKMMDSKGNLLDSSDDKPVAIIRGKNQVFDRVENAISNLSIGETKRVAVQCNEAYGEYNPELVLQVPRSKMRGNLTIGSNYEVESDDGTSINMTLVDEKNDIFILDGNHTFAGIDLLFQVEVVKRRMATTHEKKTGNIKLEL